MLAQADARPAARLVQRRLPLRLDPFALYAALGAAADTALFEGMSGPTLLMERAALRAECRGELVTLRALSANGESLLERIRTSLSANIVAGEDAVLTLRFPLSRSLDSEERLLAPSPLHAIRSLLHSAMPEGAEPFAALALGVIAFDYAGLGEDCRKARRTRSAFRITSSGCRKRCCCSRPACRRASCAPHSRIPDPDRTERNYHDAIARLGQLVEACERATPPEPSSLPCPRRAVRGRSRR
jgi:hypothetical protein